MQRGFRVIDSDAHSMEPMELWDKYLDPKFRPWAPGGAKNKNIAGRRRVNEVGMGRRLDGTAGPPFIRDGKGGLITYDEAYAPYIERQYDPGAYPYVHGQRGHRLPSSVPHHLPQPHDPGGRRSQAGAEPGGGRGPVAGLQPVALRLLQRR